MTGKWNPATKKMEFPKVEPGAKATGERVPRTHTLVSISKATLKSLADIARKDGAQIAEATSEQGAGAQNTRLATPYILAVVDEYINSRNAPSKSS